MNVSNRIQILLCAILVFGGCAEDSKRSSVHIPQASDTLYTARAAMLVYGSDPDRALTIIDSALIVGNVDAFEADYLRAKVYAQSPVDPRWDEALALCQDLLQRDSTRAVSVSTADNRSNVLQLMMDTFRRKKDYEHWLIYATQLADLNRQWGHETEALRMEAEIGNVLTYLSRHDEGLAKLDRFDISRRTLNALLAVHAGGQSFTAYINAMRMEDAVRLLREEPQMSLTEIAENVGFTPSTFRDQFKRQFGMTPTEYRQNL